MGNAAGNVTRERMIVVAERLYAQRGLDAVSLREIGEEAGQRNTAVAHYYFGGRDGLMRAIFDYRQETIGPRRAELIEQVLVKTDPGDPERVRMLVEANALPLFEQLAVGHFVRYVAKLLDHGAGWTYVADAHMSNTRRIEKLLRAEMAHLSKAVFVQRFRSLMNFTFFELASRQRDTPPGTPLRLDDDAYLDEVIGAGVALLLVPTNALAAR